MLGCPPSDPRPTDRLVLGTRTEPRTLDPAFVRRAGAQEIARLLYRDLTDFDVQWRLTPALSAALPRAETSSAGWSVDWRLRPDLKWSDGRPLTSADVVFGHRIEADPGLAAVNHHDASLVAGIDVVDAHRFRVHWRQPFAGYRAPRVHAILPQHRYPRPVPGEPFAGLRDASVSSGPFRVARWVRGRQLVLTRSLHWSGPTPAMETIVFRFLQSEDAIEAELLAGTIDAVGEASGLSPDRAASLAERLADTHDVVFTDSAVRLGVECRMDHPLVGRADIRHALSAAVDRHAFANVAYGGAARPADGLFPHRHPAYMTATSTAKVGAEVLRALEGHPSVPLQFASDSQAARRAAVYLQSAWAHAGFPVVLDGRPFSVLLNLLAERKHAPLVLLALRMRPDWDARSVLLRDGAQNYGGYVDVDVEGWIHAARATADPTAWTRFLQNVERRFRRDLPSIPLLFRRTASVRPKGLEGWRPTGTTTPVTWNAETWRWSRQ